MTVKELKEKLSLQYVVEGESERIIKGGYSGDLLSFVMSRIKESDVWLTVMGNINSIAVASLSECACILLTENSDLDEDAKKKAFELSIPVLKSEENAFELSSKIKALLYEA